MMRANEQFIDTVDLRQLRSGRLWPIMGLLAPHFVEEIELGRYMRRLLATHRWSVVRVVPHPEARMCHRSMSLTSSDRRPTRAFRHPRSQP